MFEWKHLNANCSPLYHPSFCMWSLPVLLTRVATCDKSGNLNLSPLQVCAVDATGEEIERLPDSSFATSRESTYLHFGHMVGYPKLPNPNPNPNPKTIPAAQRNDVLRA